MSREAVLATLADFPERLRDAAQVAHERAVPAGEWTVDEVVRHLTAVEMLVHQSRLSDLVTSGDPRWEWTEPPPWTGEPT